MRLTGFAHSPRKRPPILLLPASVCLIVGLVGCGSGGSGGGPSVLIPTARAFTGVGTANIAATITSFQTAIGGVNNSATATPQASGFRVINWDTVAFDGTDFAGRSSVIVPSKIVGIPVSRYQNNGVLFDRLTAVASDGFVSANPAAVSHFPAFSGANVFAPISTNQVTVTFVTPLTPPTAPTPAAVRAFGAVFLDVNTANSTTIEYFAGTQSLGRFPVPVGAKAGDAVFSGMVFDKPYVTSVVVTYGTSAIFNYNGGAVTRGLAEFLPTTDLVAGDDMVYSEPATRVALTQVPR